MTIRKWMDVTNKLYESAEVLNVNPDEKPELKETEADTIELAHELEDAMEKIVEGIQEAKEVLRNAPRIVQDRAKGYWVAQLEMAVNDDHHWLGRGSVTMRDTVDELRNWGTDKDDVEESAEMTEGLSGAQLMQIKNLMTQLQSSGMSAEDIQAEITKVLNNVSSGLDQSGKMPFKGKSVGQRGTELLNQSEEHDDDVMVELDLGDVAAYNPADDEESDFGNLDPVDDNVEDFEGNADATEDVSVLLADIRLEKPELADRLEKLLDAPIDRQKVVQSIKDVHGKLFAEMEESVTEEVEETESETEETDDADKEEQQESCKESINEGIDEDVVRNLKKLFG